MNDFNNLRLNSGYINNEQKRVKELQTLLSDIYTDDTIEVTGIFDLNTEILLKKYQKENSIFQSGILDDITYNKLYSQNDLYTKYEPNNVDLLNSLDKYTKHLDIIKEVSEIYNFDYCLILAILSHDDIDVNDNEFTNYLDDKFQLLRTNYDILKKSKIAIGDHLLTCAISSLIIDLDHIKLAIKLGQNSDYFSVDRKYSSEIIEKYNWFKLKLSE